MSTDSSSDFTRKKKTLVELARKQLLEDSEVRKSFLDEKKEQCVVNEYGCWISSLIPTKNNGYVQVSFQGTKPICLHALSAYDRFGKLPGKGQDVSHLCHNPCCFNPSHLCYESRQLNNQRKGCIVCIKDEQGLTRLLCTHEPPCILTSVPPSIKLLPLYKSSWRIWYCVFVFNFICKIWNLFFF